MRKSKLMFLFIFLSSGKFFTQGPPVFSDSPILLGLEGSGVRTFGEFVFTESGGKYIHAFGLPCPFCAYGLERN